MGVFPMQDWWTGLEKKLLEGERKMECLLIAIRGCFWNFWARQVHRSHSGVHKLETQNQSWNNSHQCCHPAAIFISCRHTTSTTYNETITYMKIINKMNRFHDLIFSRQILDYCQFSKEKRKIILHTNLCFSICWPLEGFVSGGWFLKQKKKNE